ncbi:archease [Candidatus Bathycorpusculum sp.]|jgi:SHS2 domain-containing protein|uniref:archease n=1 Tax=Candidatus Bathycorpusculum sp. TaxID=2994959 RepID=UPI00281C8699|nr:archease [Candidatus Termitimicrobium sp.]MCL2431251.1 archease [Candidatus Termitimicrobium sp.]
MSNSDRVAGKFEFLEHTADVYIRTYGTQMEEAYENAALALFETMTNSAKIAQTQEDTFEVEAEDQYALLYNWLEALLVKFETEGMLYSKFQISDWHETSENFKFTAKAWGEKFNPKKHPQKVGVKAITYHLMVIIREPERVVLEFILDI